MSATLAPVRESWPAVYCPACHWTGSNLDARWCPTCDRTQHLHHAVVLVVLTANPIP